MWKFKIFIILILFSGCVSDIINEDRVEIKSMDISMISSDYVFSTDINIVYFGKVLNKWDFSIKKNDHYTSLNQLLKEEKYAKEILKSENFENGFGATFLDYYGNTYFIYVIKTHNSSFICQQQRESIDDNSEIINICKSIK